MQKNSDSRLARSQILFLISGICAGPLFILLFLLEGATRPDYDPFRFAVSSLSIGTAGWMQIANFLVTGLLIIAFAVGLRRQSRNSQTSIWAPALIGLTGIGLVGAGIFVSDPIFGYPTYAPLRLTQFTIHGHLHDLFSMFFFTGLPGACFVLSRRFAAAGDRKWAAYSIATAIAMIIAFVLTAMGFKQTPGFVQIAGVLQRVTIIIGLTWLTLFALRELQSSPKLDSSAPSLVPNRE